MSWSNGFGRSRHTADVVSGFGVQLTQGAEDDLEDTYDYVALQKSSWEALALLDAFGREFGKLEQFPERGSALHEPDALGLSEFRQLVVTPYRIVYRIIDRTVFIRVIADGRRDMQSLLERRLLHG
jgi:toxin ParE1/3/4